MEEIQAILKSIDCEQLISVFEEQEIDREIALSLEDQELKELIPKIGPRIKFKKALANLKAKYSDIPILYADDFAISTPTPSSTEDTDIISTSSSVPKLDDLTPKDVLVPNQENIHREYKENTGSLDGRAILREGRIEAGLLKEGSRRKLSQLLILSLLEQDPARTISTQEFYRLATDICELFAKESVVVYYSAYLSSANGNAKKNASGKLYESYISRRRKLRESGHLLGTRRSSSKSSSSSTSVNLLSENAAAEDEGENAQTENLQWLKNNVDPWQTVEAKWTDTAYHRLKQIAKGEGNITDYYRNFPALKQPQGYVLLQQDFRHLYPGKENNLFSKLDLKKERIIEYAKKKLLNTRDKFIKNAMNDLLDCIDDADSITCTNVALMLLAFVINTSPARKQKNKPVWKPSRAEICQGFIAQAATEGDVTSHIITRRETLLKLGRTLQPFVIFVGKSPVKVTKAYVVINESFYAFQQLITAVDCAFQIYHATGAYYPEESQDIWTSIQVGFYEIKTKFDRNTQAVNTLLTDLELI